MLLHRNSLGRYTMLGTAGSAVIDQLCKFPADIRRVFTTLAAGKWIKHALLP